MLAERCRKLVNLAMMLSATALLTGCGKTVKVELTPATVAIGPHAEYRLSDQFNSDSRSEYEIDRKTDNEPDEYDAIMENDAAEVFYMAKERSLYVETKDNDSITLSRNIDPMTSGTVSITIKPHIIYSANGRVTLTLHTEDGASAYHFDLAGGFYDVGLSRTVNGVTTSDLHKGPYFTSMHKLGDYDGEMEIRWKVLEPTSHIATVQFGPDGAVATINGVIVSQLSYPAATLAKVNRISMRFFQVECELQELIAAGK